MIKWRCTLCGECCKRYVPLVLPEDVQHIQDSRKLPMSTFLTFYRSTDFEEPLDEADERFFKTGHGKLVMGLSRVELTSGEGACFFLKNNLCSIHAVRPFICRQYPFEPQERRNIRGPFKLMDNPCFGNHAQDEIVDEGPVRLNFQAFQQKQNEYLRKIKEWNDSPESGAKDIGDFLLFVGFQWS